MCLAQGHKMVTPVGSNLGPLDSESDALPIRHRAPIIYDMKKIFFETYILLVAVKTMSLQQFLSIFLKKKKKMPSKLIYK